MYSSKKSVSYLAFLVVFIISFIPHSQVSAASFNQAMLRLDRLAPQSSLTGLLCVTPSSAGAGTENKVTVQFPSDFSLSTTSSNWTTDTSHLPAGATAWPTISSTAQSVSGSSVTFGSGDLTSSSGNYCFTFIASSSTVGDSGAKLATVKTYSASNSLIDQQEIGFTVTKDTIGVSATVPAQPTDFSASLRQNVGTPTAKVAQNWDLSYTLSYSSALPYPTSITLESSWSQGTIVGSNIPTVDIVDYSIGTAGNAYNDAPPVIDPLNRTITWTIPSFPAHGSGEVTFRLRTTNSYTDSKPVTFTVSGRVLGPGTASVASSITDTFMTNYSSSQSSGPTETPKPQAPTPPTKQPAVPLRIQTISMRTISTDEASIEVETSEATTLRIIYGTSPSALAKSLTDLVTAKNHLIPLTGLAQNQRYYFRIIATGPTGKTSTSDLYSFSTSAKMQHVRIAQDSLIFTSDKNLLFTLNDKGSTGGRAVLLLPPKILFETQLRFENDTQIKEIYLLSRQKKLLGINSYSSEETSLPEGTAMLETSRGVYTGRLRTNEYPDDYELSIRLRDYDGNISEIKIADLIVSKAFTIFREDNHDPVENARVFLSLYNERTKLFVPISSQVLPIVNPIRSNINGIVPAILPAGRYRAEISALGFTPSTIEFTLGAAPSDGYPTVLLKKHPFNLIYGAQYIGLIASDLAHSLDAFVHDIGTSKRTFNFMVFVIVISSSIITLLALSHKTNVRINRLPRYFHSLLKNASADDKSASIYSGIITNGHTKALLSNVDIFVSEVKSGKTIFHTKSTSSGKFKLALSTKSEYLMTLEKLGYHPVMIHLRHLSTHEEQQLAMLETSEALTQYEVFRRIVAKVLSVSFEITLLLSTGAALLLCFTVGFLPAFPFLILSLFNISFWLLHSIHLNT